MIAAVEFEMAGYRFRFGPSVSDGPTTFAPRFTMNVLWRWNGYYWQIELRDCTTIDEAKHAMAFKLADERMEMAL